MIHSFILDSAVQVAEAMQDLESVSFLMGAEHSQKVKAAPIKNDSGSIDCVDLAASTAEFRFIAIAEITLVSGRDGSGIYGGIFHYSLIFAITGSALLAFLYFWKKKRLDFDEEPKMQMMRDDSKEDSHGP